mgnify:CR=1 FL=1
MQELKDKVSYAVGLSIAESLKSQQLGSLDLNFLKDGIQDVFEQKELKINPQEAMRIGTKLMTHFLQSQAPSKSTSIN